MRARWRTVSALWDANKQPVNRLTLLGQRWTIAACSPQQIEWLAAASAAALRVVYGKLGATDGGGAGDRNAVVDKTLFWIPRDSGQEARLPSRHHQSATFSCEAADPLMTQGPLGFARLAQAPLEPARSRDSIPVTPPLGGRRRGRCRLPRARRGNSKAGTQLSSATSRQIVRQWLADSPEGREVERAVGELLAGAD